MSATATTNPDDAVRADQIRRIENTKISLDKLEASLNVTCDMPFWLGRIRRACKRGRIYTSNAWSLRGDATSSFYREELSRRLGPGFTVSRTQYRDPLGLFEPEVLVYW